MQLHYLEELHIISTLCLIVLIVLHLNFKVLKSKTLQPPRTPPQPAAASKFPKRIEHENPQSTPLSISPKTEEELFRKLEDFEKRKLYLRQQISLSSLASEFQTNTKYLSFIIKKYRNDAFKGYINRLRINYIISKLQTDTKFQRYKISQLATECGFSSHSQFATTFKNITDVSPSIFINQYISKKD